MFFREKLSIVRPVFYEIIERCLNSGQLSTIRKSVFTNKRRMTDANEMNIHYINTYVY